MIRIGAVGFRAGYPEADPSVSSVTVWNAPTGPAICQATVWRPGDGAPVYPRRAAARARFTFMPWGTWAADPDLVEGPQKLPAGTAGVEFGVSRGRAPSVCSPVKPDFPPEKGDQHSACSKLWAIGCLSGPCVGFFILRRGRRFMQGAEVTKVAACGKLASAHENAFEVAVFRGYVSRITGSRAFFFRGWARFCFVFPSETRELRIGRCSKALACRTSPRFVWITMVSPAR